jgi:hypothetical protein
MKIRTFLTAMMAGWAMVACGGCTSRDAAETHAASSVRAATDLPAIPVSYAYPAFDVVVGPIFVAMVVGGDHYVLEVHYDRVDAPPPGMPGECYSDPANRLTLGVVQDGQNLGNYPISVSGRGDCLTHVPVPTLRAGPIGFYVFDERGHFDSNAGANYNFLLRSAPKTLDAPLIPVGQTAFPVDENVAEQGPVGVEIEPDARGELTLQISYRGFLCNSANAARLKAGFVQHDALIGMFPITRAADGLCSGNTIPLGDLTNGLVGIYITDEQGGFDSNLGQNYSFTLQKP